MKKKIIIICLIVIILIVGLNVGGIFLLKDSKIDNKENQENKELVIDKESLEYVYNQDIVKKYGDIRNIPSDYSKDKAIEDKVYVSTYDEVYNNEIIEKFYESYKNKQECFMRIMRYTLEGDPIITDVLYDKDKVYVVVDDRRDRYASEGNVTLKVFDKFGVEKEQDNYYWIAYNGDNNEVEDDNYWSLANVDNEYINKLNKENIVVEKISIDKFYEIILKNGIEDVRFLDKDYSFDDTKKDKCRIYGDNAFCFNTLDNFIKDYKDKKTTAIRIVTNSENGIIIKDVYYDNDLDKIFLVVDNSRVNNIPNKDKDIKLLEYVKIREYSSDKTNKVDLIADGIQDDYYLCDCIWEDDEVFGVV